MNKLLLVRRVLFVFSIALGIMMCIAVTSMHANVIAGTCLIASLVTSILAAVLREAEDELRTLHENMESERKFNLARMIGPEVD